MVHIRYIITVNALAEGWDCSFAYILISVANIGSKIAVEQIIGRIMRMPYAIRKESEDLNRSYVFASTKNFQDATNQIILGLEKNGYSKYDIVNSDNKNEKYQLEIERKEKTDFAIPIFSFKQEHLSIEDLIGDQFKLSENIESFYFEVNNNTDKRVVIDLDKGANKLRASSGQEILNLNRLDRNITKSDLIQWLDKRLRFTSIDKLDKTTFINKSIDSIKNYTLSDLSINRFVLLDKLNEKIEKILVTHTKNKFYGFLKEKKIELVDSDNFTEKIILSERNSRIFTKNYYYEIDALNKEEQNFSERLDTLPNIKFWIRNRERKDPFYLQGWKKHKFYPDFIANTKQGNILAIEWKGEDRISNENTAYKLEIAKIWEKLGNCKLHFLLVSNKNIEEELNKIKDL